MSSIPGKAPAARGGGMVRRASLTVVALAGAGVLVAGCSSAPSGPGVAGAAATTSASPSAAATGSAQSQALAYASCMRAHGVPTFPDPTVQNGSVGFNFTGTGVDQNSAAYSSARAACQSLRGGGTSSSGSSVNYPAELNFSKCMRSHGVTDFPDPNKNGGFSGTSTMNPGSPTFQNAQSYCMKASGLGSGSSNSGSSS